MRKLLRRLFGRPTSSIEIRVNMPEELVGDLQRQLEESITASLQPIALDVLRGGHRRPVQIPELGASSTSHPTVH